MAFNSEDVRDFKLKESKIVVLEQSGPIRLVQEHGRLYDTFYVVLEDKEIFRSGMGASKTKEGEARVVYNHAQANLVPILATCGPQSLDGKTLKAYRDFRYKKKGNILHFLISTEEFTPALQAFVDKELEPNADGLTPLMYAIRRKKESWRKLLDVLPPEILKDTFLKVCGDEEYKDILKHFLKESRMRLYHHLYDGLHHSIKKKNILGAKILLEPRYELDLSFASDPEEPNVFHLAAEAANLELLQLLIDRTKPEQQLLWRACANFNTPIDLAALHDKSGECVQLFVKNNVEATEKTVLNAFTGNHESTLQFLFEKFPVIDENQGLYRTILCASEENTYESTLLLLKEGIDPNPPGDAHMLSSEPPLHVACKKGLGDLMKALVVFGANVHAQFDGQTAYQIAQKCGHEYIARNLRDIGGHEPLDYEFKQVPSKIDPYRDSRFCTNFLDGYCEEKENCPKLHGELDESLPPLESTPRGRYTHSPASHSSTPSHMQTSSSSSDQSFAEASAPPDPSAPMDYVIGEVDEPMQESFTKPPMGKAKSITDWLVGLSLPEYIAPLHQHAMQSVGDLTKLGNESLRSVFISAGVTQKHGDKMESSLASISRQTSEDSKMEIESRMAGTDKRRSFEHKEEAATQSSPNKKARKSAEIEQKERAMEPVAPVARHNFDENGPINILCCDGGGIRGLVTLELLCEVERRMGVPIEDIFHFVSGTSTGGILASAVGLWPYHSLPQVRQIYFKFAKEVFKGSRIYPRDTLISLMNTEFKKRRMMPDKREPPIRVAVIAADSSHTNPATFVFRNYKPEDGSYSGSCNATIIESLCATSAAPSYFHAYDLTLDGAKRTFLDGGMLHNNPTICALEETAGQKTHCVVSFGTGSDPHRELDMKLNESLSNLDFSDKFKVGLALYHMKNKDFSSIADYFVNCVAGSDVDVATARRWVQRDRRGHFFRLQPDLGDEHCLLNETQDDVLINMCWKTRVFVYQNRSQFKRLCEVLSENLRKKQ